MSGALNEAGFFEGLIGTVLINGAKSFCGQLDLHELVEFRNPNTLRVKVGSDEALVHLGHVASDTTFFLGQTRTVNLATNTDLRTSDTANSRHNFSVV